MLVEMAICDAYGAGFEFVPRKFLDENHTMDKYVRNPRYPRVGCYTDDTQMALALSRLMLEGGDPNQWTTADLIRVFFEEFARDPRLGYATGFYQLLSKWEGCYRQLLDDPVDFDIVDAWVHTICPHSHKNGGAMRAGPLGLLPRTDMVVDRAMFQASITHATYEGLVSSAASALMVHYCHYNLGALSDLPCWLDRQLPGFDWSSARDRHHPVSTRARDAIQGAVWALVRSATLTGVLRRCVDYGGDTDTVAAIAGCAASCSAEIEQILPPQLVQDIEGGRTSIGWSHLSALDQLFLQKFPQEKDKAQ